MERKDYQPRNRDTLRRHELSHNLARSDTIAADVVLSSRVCAACTKARAKCSRTQPCHRCDTRGIECTYPSTARRETGNAATVEAETHQTASSQSIAADEPVDCDQEMPGLESHSQPSDPSSLTTLIPLPQPPAAEMAFGDYAHTLQSGPNEHPMTSINWLSMDTMDDWNLDLDFTAMSRIFQPGANGTYTSVEGSGFDLAQRIQEVSPGQPMLQSPRSFQGLHTSQTLALNAESQVSPADSNVATTPASQMSNVVGGLYRHGQGSRIARQRSVFAKTNSDALRTHRFSPETDSTFQIVDMESVMSSCTSADDRFPVPDETYATVVAVFENLCFASSHPYPVFSSGHFIPRRAMEFCISVYFKTLDAGLPIVHETTLDLGHNNWLLALALCVAGCSALQCAQNSRSLLEFLKRALAQETALWTEGSTDQTLAFAQINLLTYVLFQLQSREQDFQAASILSVLATLCGRSSWLQQNREVPISCPNQSSEALEQAWKRWVMNESLTRIAYATFLEDQIASTIQSLPRTALFSLSDIAGFLPSHEKIWNARSAEEWCRQVSESACPPTLQSILQNLYSGQALERDIGDFTRIITTHALCRRVIDVRHHQEEFLWKIDLGRGPGPHDERQNLETNQSVYEVWRNSTLDCLDSLHWHAHEVTVQSWGLEPGQVLHLHMARLILLSPLQDIEKLIQLRTANVNTERSEAVKSFLRDTRSHEASMTNIARWLRQDYFKARLALVHAGALLWYMRRFSVGSHFEPTAIYMACITIWAYGTYWRLLQNNAQPDLRAADGSLHLPPMIQIDRPCDDELVQTFIRQGNLIPPYMTGVGFVCEAGSAARIPRLSAELMTARCHSWRVCKQYQAKLFGLAESCAE